MSVLPLVPTAIWSRTTDRTVRQTLGSDEQQPPRQWAGPRAQKPGPGTAPASQPDGHTGQGGQGSDVGKQEGRSQSQG